MYDYVSKKSRHELTVSAIRYFREKNNLQEALRFLQMLKTQGYSKKKAMPILEGLGKEFARKDFHDQRDVKPVLLVMSYIGQDDWMAKFRSAYESEAKQLRH
jgi:DNA polymerase/3'-5' exonuclease PolX